MFARRKGNPEEGFTLVELLIVCVVTPLIVGGLSIGLLSVFSIQSSVSNRLGDTGDSQVVAANFESDVQSAAEITTAPNLISGGSGVTQECGPTSQVSLVGFEWNYSTLVPTTQSPGYLDVVDYDDVKNGSTYDLVRYSCTSGPSATGSSTIISFNVEAPCVGTISATCQGWPTVYPDPAGSVKSPNYLASQGWTVTTAVTKVEFPLAEPNSTEVGGKYQYTLAGVPADYTAKDSDGGSPFTVNTTSGCNFATPGTGQYASTMCLVDFSSLTGSNLLAAENGCLEMSVGLPGGSTLYFCVGITGAPVAPSALPTWQNGFLGNACSGSTSGCTNGTPFYTGIAGQPALYQTRSGTTNINFTKIVVVNAQGLIATGWEAVSADAESTDAGESISWSTPTEVDGNGNPLYGLTILPNSPSDPLNDPVGNACNSGAGLTETNNDNTVTCAVPPNVNVGLKTGTALVWAPAPPSMSVTMIGTGLEAIVFGLLLS
jgi:type II secretory pathway pseudopilin PulG